MLWLDQVISDVNISSWAFLKSCHNFSDFLTFFILMEDAQRHGSVQAEVGCLAVFL